MSTYLIEYQIFYPSKAPRISHRKIKGISEEDATRRLEKLWNKKNPGTKLKIARVRRAYEYDHHYGLRGGG